MTRLRLMELRFYMAHPDAHFALCVLVCSTIFAAGLGAMAACVFWVLP